MTKFRTISYTLPERPKPVKKPPSRAAILFAVILGIAAAWEASVYFPNDAALRKTVLALVDKAETLAKDSVRALR